MIVLVAGVFYGLVCWVYLVNFYFAVVLVVDRLILGCLSLVISCLRIGCWRYAFVWYDLIVTGLFDCLVCITLGCLFGVDLACKFWLAIFWLVWFAFLIYVCFRLV